MIKYELIEPTEIAPSCLKATYENDVISFIPTDPANSDYQAYLATLVTESAPTA